MSSVSSDHQYRISSGAGCQPSLARKFVLEILSGKTRFPNRPMPCKRLSIGSGSKCWLQLGGPGIPEIHSWMEVGRKEIALYVFEDNPAIQVNGSKVQFALLKGGEALQIGSFEFKVHAELEEEPRQPWHRPHLTSEQIANLKAGLEKPVENLTAEELVDLLEAEMTMIERQEARERAGMLKLMQAVRETQHELEIESAQHNESAAGGRPETDTAVAEAFISRIETVTRSLRERATQLKDEETVYAQAADNLLRTQERLIEQMDQLILTLDAQHAGENDPENSDDPPHAIAG